MTEQEIKRGLGLVRYGGIVITVVVFVILLGFALVTGSALGQDVIGPMLIWIVGLTLLTAVLSIVVYFGYRQYLLGRAKK